MVSELAVVGILRMDASRRVLFACTHVIDVAALLREYEACDMCKAKVTITDVRLYE